MERVEAIAELIEECSQIASFFVSKVVANPADFQSSKRVLLPRGGALE